MFFLLLLGYLFISIVFPVYLRLKGVILAHFIITITFYLFTKPTGNEFAHQVGTADMFNFAGTLFPNFLYLPVTFSAYWFTDD